MNDLLYQGWYALRMAWSRAVNEISGHFLLAVTVAATLLCIWLLLSPQVRSKGS